MMDSRQWKRLLCSSHFKTESKDLREELAKFARKIATETVDPATLEAYNICRLIPLDQGRTGPAVHGARTGAPLPKIGILRPYYP